MPGNGLRKRLTPEEKAFVLAYVNTHDPMESARVALPHLAESSLNAAGHRLLGLTRVRKAIDWRIAKRIPGPLEILGEAGEIATLPIDKLVQVQTDSEGNPVGARLNLGDKLRALEMVGKHHGVFMDPLQRRLADLVGMEVEELRQAIDARRAQARRAEKAQKSLRRKAVIEIAARRVDDEPLLLNPPEIPADPLPHLDSAAALADENAFPDQADLPFPGPSTDLDDPKG